MSTIIAGESIPKKRGRRKKEIVFVTNTENTKATTDEMKENIIISIEEAKTDVVVKKRGRKPKGGKLIMKQNDVASTQNAVSNIILHLKCSMQDLSQHNNTINNLVTDPLIYNPTIPPNILTYNNEDKQSSFSVYDAGKNETTDLAYNEIINKNFKQENTVCQLCNLNLSDTESQDKEETNLKDINTKLKKLKLLMYKNTNQEKKSACFWCTCEFDNPACYIPKHEMDNELYGYGSFCRPECAVAFLMKENIDDSTKFERYHLLNQIYSKVYNFKKNIKPAPNPYYLLDKFYGNLSIQEYRKLLKTEHMLLVIDKPMTRILPELHEDSEDFIINIYGGTNTQNNRGGVYKVKRESEKKQGPSKSSIIKDKFGVS
jgi:hypothetical protein